MREAACNIVEFYNIMAELLLSCETSASFWKIILFNTQYEMTSGKINYNLISFHPFLQSISAVKYDNNYLGNFVTAMFYKL